MNEVEAAYLRDPHPFLKARPPGVYLTGSPPFPLTPLTPQVPPKKSSRCYLYFLANPSSKELKCVLQAVSLESQLEAQVFEDSSAYLVARSLYLLSSVARHNQEAPQHNSSLNPDDL